jgi:hypothetical protein
MAPKKFGIELKMNTDRSPVILILIMAMLVCAIAGGIVSFHPNKEELERYRGFLRAAEANLAAALQKAEVTNHHYYQQLKVSDANLAWSEGANFEFTLSNNSASPVQKIHCSAQLVRDHPSLEVVAKEDFSFSFDTPLASGESKRLQISSASSASWSSPLIRDSLVKSHGVSFSISITGAERTDGVAHQEANLAYHHEISHYKKEVAKYREEIRKRE